MVVLAIWIGNSIVDIEGWHNLPKKTSESNAWLMGEQVTPKKNPGCYFSFLLLQVDGQIGKDREDSSKEHHSWISSRTS